MCFVAMETTLYTGATIKFPSAIRDSITTKLKSWKRWKLVKMSLSH